MSGVLGMLMAPEVAWECGMDLGVGTDVFDREFCCVDDGLSIQ